MIGQLQVDRYFSGIFKTKDTSTSAWLVTYAVCLISAALNNAEWEVNQRQRLLTMYMRTDMDGYTYTIMRQTLTATWGSPGSMLCHLCCCVHCWRFVLPGDARRLRHCFQSEQKWQFLKAGMPQECLVYSNKYYLLLLNMITNDYKMTIIRMIWEYPYFTIRV